MREILEKLQKAYTEKNPKNTAALMQEIFSSRQDILTLGTSSDEICLGQNEVEELIRNDLDGGWGDFTIDIPGAEIESDGGAAWFRADCTVKYSFSGGDEARYLDFIKSLTEKHAASPKQRLAFINWVLGIHFHRRTAGKREYLWPSELSGMMIWENDEWKIAALHFAMTESDYPDERFEEVMADYTAGHKRAREKILAHCGNEPDGEVLRFLGGLEDETDGLRFDSERVLVLRAGRFAWVMALGEIRKDISEGEIFDRALREMERLFDGDLSAEEKLFRVKRSAAYAFKESAAGEVFTLPVRFTGVLETGYGFRHRHFSYPFYWIFEGKV